MKQAGTPVAQPRRKYDQNFKREAVALWLNSGKTAEAVGAELGIAAERLYAWRNSLGPAGCASSDLEEQNAALRRENDYLRQQRDILKKTLGILSEPPPNVTNGFKR